jgi:hypothetical protein
LMKGSPITGSTLRSVSLFPFFTVRPFRFIDLTDPIIFL